MLYVKVSFQYLGRTDTCFEHKILRFKWPVEMFAAVPAGGGGKYSRIFRLGNAAGQETSSRDAKLGDGTHCLGSSHVPTDCNTLWGMAQLNTDHAVHEAARAGLIDKLAEMLAVDSSLIDAKGVDARTPLHCAGTVAVAALLLDRGARIDARDEDHDSTPAQWRIGESPDVARFLLERGAKADIFLAAALGDLPLAKRLVTEDRGRLAHRIGKAPEFPPLGHGGRGGTIYQWTLRFNCYPHQIALMKGHQAMFDFLYAESDVATRLLVHCVLAQRAEAQAIAKEHPEIVPELPDVDRELVAK